ncbi:MAG: hypothetical protein ABI357_00465 [Granulicella sp.]
MIAQNPKVVPKIPAVHSTSFSGDTVELPRALHGKVGVLVIGFSQSSRKAVEEWGKGLSAIYGSSPTVVYYEMPVLASVPRLLRGFVTSRIRAAVSEKARPHFVPLLQDEDTWRELARCQAPDDAYVLLVDGVGVIQWQTQGPPTEAGMSALKHHVEALQRQ